MSNNVSEYNIIGSVELIKETIVKFNLKIVDKWPCSIHNTLDYNVEVDIDQEDDFSDWCKEKEIEFKLI